MLHLTKFTVITTSAEASTTVHLSPDRADGQSTVPNCTSLAQLVERPSACDPYSSPYCDHTPLSQNKNNMLWKQNNILREQYDMLWEQNNVLREQDNMLWEQNNILGEQDNMLWEQNNILREQDNVLWEQNSMLWEHYPSQCI